MNVGGVYAVIQMPLLRLSNEMSFIPLTQLNTEGAPGPAGKESSIQSQQNRTN